MEDFLENFFFRWQGTGSRFICNPPVMDTDEDYICYFPSRLEVLGHLHNNGWEWTNNDGSHYKDIPDFLTFRKDHYNLIVTDDDRFYQLFCLATDVATIKNIREKEERIRLFQAILYGVYK